MRALVIFLGLVVSAQSFAMERQSGDSVKPCTFVKDADLSDVKNYIVAGSSLSGAAAKSKMDALENRKASVSVQQDLLGAARYKVVQLAQVFDNDGGNPNSCQGQSFKKRIETCTSSLSGSAVHCAQICESHWIGQDCR